MIEQCVRILYCAGLGLYLAEARARNSQWSPKNGPLPRCNPTAFGVWTVWQLLRAILGNPWTEGSWSSSFSNFGRVEAVNRMGANKIWPWTLPTITQKVHPGLVHIPIDHRRICA